MFPFGLPLKLANGICSGETARPELLLFACAVTGEKILIHPCYDRESNPGRLRDRPTLYHVALKAGLYRKAVQVYHIPITTTYYLFIYRFVCESQIEQPLNTKPPSLLGHQAHQIGLFTLGARCNR